MTIPIVCACLGLVCCAIVLRAADAPASGGKSEANGEWATAKVRRLAANPIITADLFKDKSDGGNINGPTLVRAPSWVTRPLGKYYLYFAHHAGKYIRLAYADDLAGPWKLHEGGVLSLNQLPIKMGHIASPEVVVDEKARRVILYYHGPVNEGDNFANPGKWTGQLTFAATSEDGLRFTPGKEVISSFYLRVFHHGGRWYGICKDGNIGNRLCRGGDPLTAFERGAAVFPNSRHFAVLPRGDALWVFFSRVGDSPEHIVVSRFNLKEDWQQWGANAPPPMSILRPREVWEGTQYELKPSKSGAAEKVQELRDPFIYDEGGKLYLLYTVAGEMGIAVAELAIGPDS